MSGRQSFQFKDFPTDRNQSRNILMEEVKLMAMKKPEFDCRDISKLLYIVLAILHSQVFDARIKTRIFALKSLYKVKGSGFSR